LTRCEQLLHVLLACASVPTTYKRTWRVALASCAHRLLTSITCGVLRLHLCCAHHLLTSITRCMLRLHLCCAHHLLTSITRCVLRLHLCCAHHLLTSITRCVLRLHLCPPLSCIRRYRTTLDPNFFDCSVDHKEFVKKATGEIEAIVTATLDNLRKTLRGIAKLQETRGRLTKFVPPNPPRQ
jgi:hypothetical protein